MRCVALLSGGKDSVMAVDVARQHGWSVDVALMMRPAEDDAWMFHTPNLDVVRGVADRLGMDLVEVAARPDPKEEVEDLEAAIAQVKESHGIDGIVSGALASEYQRTRIDRIGHKLQIKSFAPLWHKDPATYMEHLTKPGYDIRFSRVAADGIPNDWAGQRLDADKLDAMKAMRTRPHIAGEGGEFETLVLDAPCYSKPIEVKASRVEETVSRATWVVEEWR